MKLLSRATALVLTALILGCHTFTTRRVIHPTVAGVRYEVRIGDQLTPGEMRVLGESLRLVGTMIPLAYTRAEEVPVYWMKHAKFDGLTVWQANGEPYILLSDDLRRSTYTGFDLFQIGSTYCHELSHALDHTKDPHTGEITDGLLRTLIPQHVLRIHGWPSIKP